MIERRPFGRTGHQSTVTLFGGAALAQVDQAAADRTLEVLLRYGVNHIDTAARYGDSELRIGPWMARHRKDFFLATKTGSRTAREAREDIHRSLERLRVDHVDLIQLHSLWHPDDWDQTMGPGGADDPARRQYATKEAVVKLLKQAVADGAQMIKEGGDEALHREIKYPYGNRMVHVGYAWIDEIEHSAEHYGQLVVYYRVNNLVPPESRPKWRGSSEMAESSMR